MSLTRAGAVQVEANPQEELRFFWYFRKKIKIPGIYSLHIFALPFALLEMLTFQIVYLQKSRLRSRSTIFAMTPFDGKYQNLQKSFHAFLR